jgi:hypothetical protein
MATLTEVRDALATLLADLPDLHGYPRAPSAAPLLPAVIILPKRARFGLAMGGGVKDEYELELAVVVQTADEALAQARLDPYLSGTGPRSVRQAIFLACASRGAGLGGLVETRAQVTGWAGYGSTFRFGTASYLGAVVAATVTTPALPG